MKLKSRVERLEADVEQGNEIVDIALDDGLVVQITRSSLREILCEINGADTGPGPARSRRSSS